MTTRYLKNLIRPFILIEYLASEIKNLHYKEILAIVKITHIFAKRYLYLNYF